jgi:hypothetical protein
LEVYPLTFAPFPNQLHGFKSNAALLRPSRSQCATLAALIPTLLIIAQIVLARKT